jgi:hypothetical protein
MNIFNFLKTKLTTKPPTLSTGDIKQLTTDKESLEMLKKFGIVSSELHKSIGDTSVINWERQGIYQVVDRSMAHPLMAGAVGLYADYASTPSQLMNSTVWVTTESREYRYQIEKLFDVINLEEVIYDWLWTLSAFGDLFVQVHGQPGVGIVSISDDQHPINISRVDYNGRLVGFYETPLGYAAPDERKLLPPWEYVHGRLLGAKKRRSQHMDNQFTEFRTISIMTPDDRRLTSKYGTSILADAFPTWKRLRLAEDSVLMARINRGVMRYVWKVAVGENQNPEAVASLVDNYIDELKRARALNTDPGPGGSGNYQDRFNAMASMEDIIVPVWGETNKLDFVKMGGEVDIKWIADIEELRNQLATALRVPLGLLSGYSKEGVQSSIGSSSIERMDIRFARQARRVQRSLINMVTRLVQIHLAYQGMDTDLNLFKIQMTETSSAEEEELKSALDKGVDVVDKLSELVIKCLGEVETDKKALLDYLNKKFLKLNDMDVEKLIKKGNPNAFKEHDRTKPVPGIETPGELPKPTSPAENPFKESNTLSDFKASLPINEAKTTEWASQWGEKTVKITPINETKKP